MQAAVSASGSVSRSVSIPSERESALQAVVVFPFLEFPVPVSIPSERESALQVGRVHRRPVNREFPFPPNGKVLCKTAPASPVKGQLWYEFQFPPNGKVLCKSRFTDTPLSPSRCFHSLRTGKCFARLHKFFNDTEGLSKVSIPSERESALQVVLVF